MEILVFHLESEAYGISVDAVRRVLAAVRVTRIPGAPAVVAGLVDLHGSLTPVFDLRRRFGMGASQVRADDHFILAMAGDRRVLLHVDRVSEVAGVDPADIGAARSAVDRAEHVSGIARLERGLVLIHDLATFLSEAESADLDRAMAAAGVSRESSA